MSSPCSEVPALKVPCPPGARISLTLSLLDASSSFSEIPRKISPFRLTTSNPSLRPSARLDDDFLDSILRKGNHKCSSHHLRKEKLSNESVELESLRNLATAFLVCSLFTPARRMWLVILGNKRASPPSQGGQ